MKKFIVLINLTFSIWIQCISQDNLFILHPIIGETIDRNEKIDYLLFPEINDSIFKYCNIKHNENKFYISSYLESDSIITFQLDSSEINQYQMNIDKLHEYYSNQTIQDSLQDLKVLILKRGNSFQIIDIHIDTEKINNEAINSIRLRDDAERLRLQKQGSDVGGIYLEIDQQRSKKKK